VLAAADKNGNIAHSVSAMDDDSSLSATENGNIKVMRMLHQYFISLAASGTGRSIVEERNKRRSTTMVTFIVAFARHKDGKGSIKTHTKHNIWYINFIRHR